LSSLIEPGKTMALAKSIEGFHFGGVPLRSAYGGRKFYIGKTRVPLETVINEYNRGETPDTIVENFDALQLADVYLVIAYYLNHRAEVDAYIEMVQANGKKMLQEIEARFPSTGFKERLLARLPKE
jgi:uncharacterized protein (DUF433 family)